MGFDKAKAISAAEKYLAQGKIPSAITEYRRIVERDPNDYSALNTLGDLYARTKKTQDAIECFQLVADHYREQGFTPKAIAVYKKISRLDPNLPAVAQRLAVLYEQQGHFVEAREQYLLIAEAYARAGQMRQSLEALRRSADLEPNNVEIRLRLGEGFLKEELHEEAADAFTEAGERLLARGNAQWALEAYTKAYKVRPLNHAVLHGLVAAHSQLGASDEAASVLEQAVAEEPRDVELRAMLSRAYLEAEDAPAAERATVALVELEASNYPQLFEVARLYLQRGDTNAAVGVLARITEPALAGRQEQKLLGLLNEALARDPEQIEALRLLLRIYTWQRDDDRMRVTLERLAEAAQTHNLVGEERRALEHLVRLVPFDQSYHERLHELGDAPEGEAEESWYEPPVAEEVASASPPPQASSASSDAATEIPAFENVFERSSGDAFAGASEAAPVNLAASGGGASEFEWNSVAVPEVEQETAEEPAAVTIDPSSSFADLNDDLNGGSSSGWPSAAVSAKPIPFEAAELGGASFEDAGLAPEKGSGEGRVKMLLAQELESVDYYLAQGYMDIARDTLDMLERQYGANEEITQRRRQMPQDGDAFGMPPDAPVHTSTEFTSNEFTSNEFTSNEFTSVEFTSNEFSGDEFTSNEFISNEVPSNEFTPAEFERFAPLEEAAEEVEIEDHLFISATAEEEIAPAVEATPAPPPSPQPTPPEPQGLQHELADMFDEFRDEDEANDPASTADYETHYNTALAYREMGLVDQAVEELQAAIALVAPLDGTPRYLQSCNLLGHCFMQKNMPRPAAMWFKKGLDTPGHTEDEYQALRFELGTAYEGMGDLERAIEVFSEVYGTDVNYRGVAAKLRDLQAKKAVTSDK